MVQLSTGNANLDESGECGRQRRDGRKVCQVTGYQRLA